MRFKGINYDTGFISAGTTTREPFDPRLVKREMHIIRDDLHCNAVRITGGHPERLEIAAVHAAQAGLEVWFCPFPNNLSSEEAARFPRRLRRSRRTTAEARARKLFCSPVPSLA